MPPLDPPGVRSRFQGLKVGPNRVLSVAPFQPYSGVLVLPRTMAPAALRRSTDGASSVGTLSALRREPQVVLIPRVMTTSFTATGTPCRGPSSSPRCTVASAAWALCRAESNAGVQKALSLGSMRWMRSTRASIRATGDRRFCRIAFAASIAERKARSLLLMRVWPPGKFTTKNPNDDIREGRSAASISGRGWCPGD